MIDCAIERPDPSSEAAEGLARRRRRRRRPFSFIPFRSAPRGQLDRVRVLSRASSASLLHFCNGQNARRGSGQERPVALCVRLRRSRSPTKDSGRPEGLGSRVREASRFFRLVEFEEGLHESSLSPGSFAEAPPASNRAVHCGFRRGASAP